MRPLIGMEADKLLPKTIGLRYDSEEGKKLVGLLEAAKVADLMEEEATASDAKRSKPDPDIVEAAIEESGIAPQNLVMIGDTPYDIDAAGKAKIRGIAFRSGGWTDEALAGAVEIHDGPADLLARFDSSLMGRDKLARD